MLITLLKADSIPRRLKYIKFEKGDQLIYKDIELISDFIEKEKILTSVQKKVILSTL